MTELVKIVSLMALFAVPVLLTYRSFLVYKNRLALIRDLDLARIQGRQWRDETRALHRWWRTPAVATDRNSGRLVQ